MVTINFPKILKSSFIVIAVLLLGIAAQAQTKPPVVQFSGIVLSAEDSSSVVPGVHVYVPKGGRGTTTNLYGYFSMPVLAGDSVIISAIGFQRQNFIIPNNQGDQYTVVIHMQPDTTILPELEVFPFPTEQMFKEAVLAMEMPDQEQVDFMKKNMNAELMARMFENMPMDGDENYKFYRQQQIMQMHQRYTIQTNPLLNPFNWMQLMKAIKNGDFKKKN